MTTSNDLNFLANNAAIKKEAFLKMCQDITANYNAIAGTSLKYISADDYYMNIDNQPALFRLFEKMDHITFDIGSPASLPDFLKRIIIKGAKMQYHPSSQKILGEGHFRWDWRAYTLNDNEIKAIAQYLNILVVNTEEPKMNNKIRYELSKLDYTQKAEYFLSLTKTKFSAVYKTHDFYFSEDNDTRDIYIIVLKNSKHRFRFTFGQSISNTGSHPSAYDVLACLQKYDPGTFENFCGDFGYDIDSRKAYKTYKAVMKEWKNVELLFTPEQIEQLQEIQ